MRIVVLGSNGRTGTLVTRMALERKMHVIAVVRSAGKRPDIEHENLTVAVGDPCDPRFLASVFRGCDAVVSTLGGRSPTRRATAIYPRSAEAMVKAARVTGLERVLLTSTALLFPARSFLDRCLALVARQVIRSARRMETILRESDLAWTAARCGFLNDASERGYRAEKSRLPAKGSSLSRHGLACFLVDALERRDAHRQVFGVAKP